MRIREKARREPCFFDREYQFFHGIAFRQRDSNSSDADHLAKLKAHNASPFQIAQRFERVRIVKPRDKQKDTRRCPAVCNEIRTLTLPIAHTNLKIPLQRLFKSRSDLREFESWCSAIQKRDIPIGISRFCMAERKRFELLLGY